jgi:cytochrome c1
MAPSVKRFGPALIGMTLWLSATAVALSGKRRRAPGDSTRTTSYGWVGLIALALFAVAALYVVLFGIARYGVALPKADTAPALMIRYGCAGCHTIPGVPGARGQAGPSLAGFGRRQYVGGAATNNTRNLVQWLVNPRAVAPRTAMPVTGITEAEARVVADHLLRMR